MVSKLLMIFKRTRKCRILDTCMVSWHELLYVHPSIINLIHTRTILVHACTADIMDRGMMELLGYTEQDGVPAGVQPWKQLCEPAQKCAGMPYYELV